MSLASTRLLIYAGLFAVGATTLAVAYDGPKVSKGKKVFLLGDSLGVGLSRPLKALASDHQVEFKSLTKQGTRIDSWSDNDALFRALSLYKPDLILISLGTNDEYMKLDAYQRQKPRIEKLLSRLRVYSPVAWVGPPKLPSSGPYKWIKSNGALRLIREKVPSNFYYPSEKLEIQRAPDQLHATVRGYAVWAQQIWNWIT